MDWDNVRTFLAVARRGQFLAAARQLRVNQATVARRVGALERDVGATLFERSTTGVHLTDAGKHLLAHAERMESEILQAEADVRRARLELTGQVRIGAPDGFATYFLIPALAPLMRKHVGIELQIVPMPVASGLARREVDIAITIEEPRAGRVIARKLTDYSLGIFGATRYLRREGSPKTLADLARHRLIGYAESFAFSSALSYVSELYGDTAPTLEFASAVAQVEAVRAGLGLGVLHDFIAATIEGVEPVLPERRATRSYWLAIHEDVRTLGRVRAVADHIAGSTENARPVFVVEPDRKPAANPARLSAAKRPRRQKA